MHSLIDSERVIKLVFKLCGGLVSEGSVNTIDDLRAIYLSFLKLATINAPVNESKDVFITNLETEKKLADAFHMENSLGNPDQKRGFIGEEFSAMVKDEKVDLARNALNNLRQLDNDFRTVFDLVVHSIVIRQANSSNGPVAHSSSTACAVGTIWLSMEDSLNEADIQELFIHELAHQLLFIDDFLYRDFDYERMSKHENFGLTAISLSPRPLDIVIHSILVAIELIRARQLYLGEPANPSVHPRSADIIKTLGTSIKSLEDASEYKDLITEHIRDTLKCGLHTLETCS